MPLDNEIIEQMRDSDNVRLRDLGVIAQVLSEEGLTYRDSTAISPIAVAKTIIKAQTAAGLGTFVLDDLRDHINACIARYRRFTPPPIPGQLWRYTSPADGAQVLVRWEDGWQCAATDSPVTEWWSDHSIPSWPGTFEQISD